MLPKIWKIVQLVSKVEKVYRGVCSFVSGNLHKNSCTSAADGQIVFF